LPTQSRAHYGIFSHGRDGPSKQSATRKANCTDDLVFVGERRPGTIATSNDTYRAESQSEQFARFASPWPNYRIPEITRAYKRDQAVVAGLIDIGSTS
jgi:hypothetical protein